jgi:hypothetical protein
MSGAKIAQMRSQKRFEMERGETASQKNAQRRAVFARRCLRDFQSFNEVHGNIYSSPAGVRIGAFRAGGIDSRHGRA